jgi:DNA-binding transcriptional MerR regulator
MQLSKLLGISFRTLTDWCERGIVIADAEIATGTGSRRRFGLKGIRRAWLAHHLITNLKIHRWKVKELLNKIDFTKDDPIKFTLSDLVSIQIYLDSLNSSVYLAMVNMGFREP